jgi:molybdopterin converting factor small subunit
MVVRIRLFAILRERAGRDALELRLHRGATVADAMRALSETGPLGELLDRVPVQMAVNRDYATPETPARARRRAGADPARERRQR